MRTILILFFISLISLGCQGALELDDETMSGGSNLTGENQDKSDDDDNSSANNTTNINNVDNTPDMGDDDPDMDVDEPDMAMGEPDIGPQAGQVIEFRIAAGTAEGPWNSPDTAVVLYVGQVLRIVNDDSIDHQLHAPDDGAIQHGGRMSANGGSDTFDVERADPLDPQRTSYYDHELGRPANFWIDARPLP